jgi:hypothetical protein
MKGMAVDPVLGNEQGNPQTRLGGGVHGVGQALVQNVEHRAGLNVANGSDGIELPIVLQHLSQLLDESHSAEKVGDPVVDG